MNIAFFSHGHNGDIHYSRSFILDFISRYKGSQESFDYYHAYNKRLFLDIPEINCKPMTDIAELVDPTISHKEHQNVKYINTWIGQENGKFTSQRGVSISANKLLWQEIFDSFQLGNLNDTEAYLPKVNWGCYQSSLKIENILQNYRKVILICNGETRSGQGRAVAKNLMELLKCKLMKTKTPFRNAAISPSTFLKQAKKSIDTAFIFTNRNKPNNQKNIYSISDLYGNISDGDLMECGHFAAHYADVIIGRASGPFSTACSDSSYLNPEKTFVCISILDDESALWSLDGASRKISIKKDITVPKLFNLLGE